MHKEALIPQRDRDQMVERLKVQLRLLNDHYQKAFAERNADYLGEVAVKLRLLIIDKGRANVPLLLRVAESFGLIQKVNFPEGPVKREDSPAGDFTVAETLERPGYRYNDEGVIRVVSNKNLILLWCEKLGGAHEDWTLPDFQRLMMRPWIEINGLHPMEVHLKQMAEMIIDLGRKLLAAIPAARAAEESASAES